MKPRSLYRNYVDNMMTLRFCYGRRSAMMCPVADKGVGGRRCGLFRNCCCASAASCPGRVPWASARAKSRIKTQSILFRSRSTSTWFRFLPQLHQGAEDTAQPLVPRGRTWSGHPRLQIWLYRRRMPTDQVRGLKAHGTCPATGIVGCVQRAANNLLSSTGQPWHKACPRTARSADPGRAWTIKGSPGALI
jgi:hypothetical protein